MALKAQEESRLLEALNEVTFGARDKREAFRYFVQILLVIVSCIILGRLPT